MDLLRFITAGSIDDGKSTLIGKLLHDTGNIKDDIAHSIEIRKGDVNLAHITDGLRSERENGITIDIGYKYFNTDERKYIIADAPGHFQYTKNLVTGASNVDLMIVLIDAQNGVTAQTRVHFMVASFLKLKHILVAVNKMDLVQYKEDVFNDIRNEVDRLAEHLRIMTIDFVPISALNGDNVVQKSQQTNWYNGYTLSGYLDRYPMNSICHNLPARLYIQYIIREEDRLLCFGKMLSGTIKKHDILRHYTSGNDITISTILLDQANTQEAVAGNNVCLVLDKSTTLERSDVLGSVEQQPVVSNELEVDVCWLNAEAELKPGNKYILKMNIQETPCVVSDIIHKLSMTGFGYDTAIDSATVNEFVRVMLQTDRKITYDSYDYIPEGGRGILIDEVTNSTVAAVTVV